MKTTPTAVPTKMAKKSTTKPTSRSATPQLEERKTVKVECVVSSRFDLISNSGTCSIGKKEASVPKKAPKTKSASTVKARTQPVLEGKPPRTTWRCKTSSGPTKLSWEAKAVILRTPANRENLRAN